MLRRLKVSLHAHAHWAEHLMELSGSVPQQSHDDAELEQPGATVSSIWKLNDLVGITQNEQQKIPGLFLFPPGRTGEPPAPGSVRPVNERLIDRGIRMITGFAAVWFSNMQICQGLYRDGDRRYGPSLADGSHPSWSDGRRLIEHNCHLWINTGHVHICREQTEMGAFIGETSSHVSWGIAGLEPEEDEQLFQSTQTCNV